MPKPILMTIAVEESYMGSVWNRLDTMDGVAEIRIHGSNVVNKSAIKTQKAQGSKQAGTSVKCVILGMLKKTPGLTASQMRMGVESAGRSARSIAPCISEMLKAKLIRKKKDGQSKTVYFASVKGEAYIKDVCGTEG